MYIVKYGEEYLHDPISSDRLLDALTLTAKENTCDYCDFTIFPTHPLYTRLRERDGMNPITVWDGEILLFTGFIYSLEKSIQLDCAVKCKSDLGYFEETMVRPYSTIGRKHRYAAPTTIDGFFEWLVQNHNSQTTAEKRFEIGINEGGRLGTVNAMTSETPGYASTYDIIQNELIDVYGGYLRVRNENDRRYIDYLSEWTDVNAQILDFGVNITDFIQTSDSEEVATFCVAEGAKYSETAYPYDDGYFATLDVVVDPDKTYYVINKDGKYDAQKDLTKFKAGVIYYEYDEMRSQADEPITLALAANGVYASGLSKVDDMVYDEQAVAAKGWIGTIYSDSEATDAEELLRGAMAHLQANIASKFTLEIKAVDMHLLNPDLKPIRVGEFLRCRSYPHHVDSYFVCAEISLDLTSPEQSTYTLGVAYDTLTGTQNRRIATLNKTITQNYDAAAALSEEAKQAAQDANSIARQVQENAETAIYDTVTEYALGDSSEVPPQADSDAWDTVYPSFQVGKFIWVRTIKTYGDGTIIIDDPFVSNAGGGDAAEDATVLKITSSNGILFKSLAAETVLSATVYTGDLVITNLPQLQATYGDEAYLQWYERNIEQTEWTPVSTGDPRLISNGFMLSISIADVRSQAIFRCDLLV